MQAEQRLMATMAILGAISLVDEPRPSHPRRCNFSSLSSKKQEKARKASKAAKQARKRNR